MHILGMVLRNNHLNTHQYAYESGNRAIALAIFLDTEETFNNALTVSLYEVCINREIEQILFNWIRGLLEKRIITNSL